MMLGIEVYRQPSPSRNPGGDCFACSLFAALRYLFPEKHPTFDQVWESFQYEQTNQDGTKSTHLRNHWGDSGMERAANRAAYDYTDGRVNIYTDIVLPRYDPDTWSHAWGTYNYPEGEWARRVEAWLAAGWVILIEMAYEGKGPFTKDGYRNTPDHFAIVDGQREFWKEKEYTWTDKDGVEHKSKSGSLEHETHVVCSARGPYWIRTEDLMHYHGVFAFYIMRRDKRVYRDFSWNESPENQALIKD